MRRKKINKETKINKKTIMNRETKIKKEKQEKYGLNRWVQKDGSKKTIEIDGLIQTGLKG